ncbi:MAG: ABC transporter permease [Planctomycetota bacterium]|nr:ABC transporter permease [Planctomycetota bacterium]
MLKTAFKRLLQLPLILAAVYSITLALDWAVPGNPLERPEGRRPPPEVIAAMQARYKLDNFWTFYWSYLGGVTGVTWAREQLSAAADPSEATASPLPSAPKPIFDFGPSLQYRDRSVNEIIVGSLPVSMVLGATAILIALGLGLTAGVVGAWKPNSWLDGSTLLLALLGISVPTFVVATFLQLVFAVWFPIFTVGQYRLPQSILLPAITLSLPFAAYIARLTRIGMIEALQSDYVRTARAKGASEWRVLTHHALKNAFLPVLSYLGPACAMAMTGSFVVERIYSIPGMGQHFVNAVQNKDLFLLLGIVLVFATMLILLNLAVDLLYRWVDPRVRI